MMMRQSLLMLVMQAVSLFHGYKVGLILNANYPETSAAIRRLSAFTVTQLDQSSTTIHLQEVTYEPTYLSIMQSICSLLEQNVVAILSASGSTLTKVQVNIASQFNIPIISAVATNPFLESAGSGKVDIVRLSPSDVYQSHAVFDLLMEYKWYQFSILASADDYGIDGVVQLQKLASQSGKFKVNTVQYFNAALDVSDINVDMFTKELTLIKNSLEKVIVLNCGPRFADPIVREAHKMGLMEEGFVWIATDGVAVQLEVTTNEDGMYSGYLATLPNYGKDSESYNDTKAAYVSAGGDPSDFLISSVKVSEGIKLVHRALSMMDSKGSWDSQPSQTCESSDAWLGGIEVFDEIMSLPNGIANPTYDVMNLNLKGFVKVGSWQDTIGLVAPDNILTAWEEREDIVFIGPRNTSPSGFGGSLTGYHLRVGTIHEPPIAMLSDSCTEDQYSDPDCWYGWCTDIIERLAKDLNFTYEYVRPHDNKYGAFHKDTRAWSGMVKDIIESRIDLTTVLAVSVTRSQVIGFSSPLFEDQLAMAVYPKSTRSSSNMFFFLEPFHQSVWVSIIALVLLITLLTNFLSKFSPLGDFGKKIHAMQICSCEQCILRRKLKTERMCRFADTNTQECLVDEVFDHGNELDLNNSTWLIGTGFVLQGTDKLPTAPSGRFLLFTWWFFVMILTSMYTANLTAHLTMNWSGANIYSLEDLLTQRDYSWGLLVDRNMGSMLADNANKKYKEVARKARKLETLDEAIGIVKEGGFVFIDESSVLEFNLRDDCEKTIIKTGKLINHWAIAMRANSPLAPIINEVLLQYRSEGWLTSTIDDWYSADGKSFCKDSQGSTRFDIRMLSGLFLMLGVGILFSLIAVVLEILHVTSKDRRRTGDSFYSCLRKRVVSKYVEVKEEWIKRKSLQV